ncbi:MAG: hypothetical protein U0793_16955 [Gemmataceae bacterium]
MKKSLAGILTIALIAFVSGLFLWFLFWLQPGPFDLDWTRDEVSAGFWEAP